AHAAIENVFLGPIGAAIARGTGIAIAVGGKALDRVIGRGERLAAHMLQHRAGDIEEEVARPGRRNDLPLGRVILRWRPDQRSGILDETGTTIADDADIRGE